MKICELWKEGERIWDEEKLMNFLTVEDAALARSIYISRHGFNDRYIWPYTKDSKYSVRSGYWLATHDPYDILTPPAGSLDIKKLTWKITVPPKIQHFLWNVISGAIPTAERLRSRGININSTCQRCCSQDENINHILFQCPHAMGVWRCAGYHQILVPSDDLEENIRTLMKIYNDSHLYDELRTLPFWVLWLIWKSRNEFLFNKRDEHPMEDVKRARDANDEWTQLQTALPTEVATASSVNDRGSTWVPPPEGWLKCNFDSSHQQDNDYTGVGWIIRDHMGLHIQSGHSKVQRVSTSLQAEGLGFLVVLQIAWIRGWRKMWFESDSQELTVVVNNPADNTELDNILQDIDLWTSRLPDCSLAYTNRERNKIADFLAKFNNDVSISSLIFTEPIQQVVELMYQLNS